jgi:hypothetical protein
MQWGKIYRLVSGVFRDVCRHFLPSGTGNATNPVSAVPTTDVMVNRGEIDRSLRM